MGNEGDQSIVAMRRSKHANGKRPVWLNRNKEWVASTRYVSAAMLGRLLRVMHPDISPASCVAQEGRGGCVGWGRM